MFLGHIHLTDFGLSKEHIKGDTKAQSFCGTPEYLAPEVLNHQGHGRAVDWWSLGILTYEMLYGRPPFYNRNRKMMYDAILRARLRIPPSFSVPAREFVKEMLHRDPDQRLGGGPGDFDELRTHMFFEGRIDWEQLYAKNMTPYFKPILRDDTDTSHFDPTFTRMPCVDSAPKQGQALSEVSVMRFAACANHMFHC